MYSHYFGDCKNKDQFTYLLVRGWKNSFAESPVRRSTMDEFFFFLMDFKQKLNQYYYNKAYAVLSKKEIVIEMSS